MTDKEWLEEIKELVKKIESILYDEWRQQELTNLIESLYYDDHVDWLINRVQELELEVNDWRDEAIKWQKFYEESEESHSETKELLYSTISENQRYKQALENITISSIPLEIDDAVNIARQALESEK